MRYNLMQTLFIFTFYTFYKLDTKDITVFFFIITVFMIIIIYK